MVARKIYVEEEIKIWWNVFHHSVKESFFAFPSLIQKRKYQNLTKLKFYLLFWKDMKHRFASYVWELRVTLTRDFNRKTWLEENIWEIYG